MIIKTVEPFVLHVPVTGSQIADSTHSITHWGVVGVRIETEDGLAGYGFTGTHARLPGAGTTPTREAWERYGRPAA